MIILLHNNGHSDERFNDYLIKAANFYGNSLFNKKVSRHIVVTIKFDKHLDSLGYTQVTKRNSRGKPREFLIEIHPYISGVEILTTLAHEMVHVKQFVNEELDGELTTWRGTIVESDTMDYYSLPWEIDAYGHEIGLFTNFLKQEALWEIFTGCRNPDAPYLPEQIGWKHENILSKSKGKKAPTVSEGFDFRDVFVLDPRRCEVNVDGGGGRGHSTESPSQSKRWVFDRVQELKRYLGL